MFSPFYTPINRTPNYADQTITAGMFGTPVTTRVYQNLLTNLSAVVVRKYLISSGLGLLIASGARFRIL